MQCSGDRVQALWGLLGVRLLSHHACAATLQTAPATMKSFKLPPQSWNPGLVCKFVRRGTTVYHSNSNHQNEGFFVWKAYFAQEDPTRPSFRLSWSPFWGSAPSAQSELVSKRKDHSRKHCEQNFENRGKSLKTVKSGEYSLRRVGC